jgi:hypothetical protein
MPKTAAVILGVFLVVGAIIAGNVGAQDASTRTEGDTTSELIAVSSGEGRISYGSGSSAGTQSECQLDPWSDLRAPDGSPFDPYSNPRVVIDGNSASISVKNFSDSCSYRINLASYEVFDPEMPLFVQTQKLFDSTWITIQPGQTQTLSVDLPECAFQVDLFEGPFIPTTNPNFDGVTYPDLRIFDWLVKMDLPLCTTVTVCEPWNDLRALDGGVFDPFNNPRIIVEGNIAKISVKNFSDSCVYRVNFASYEVFDPEMPLFVQTQKLFASEWQILQPGQSRTLMVNLPDLPECAYQVELFEGPFIPTTNPNFDGITYPDLHILDWLIDMDLPLCGTTGPQTASLKLVKHVINDNGGTAVVSDFNLYANDIKFVSGVAQNIQPGTYKAREDQLPGYTASDWSGDCAADGTITLAPGDNKTCHITNNDNPEIPNAAVLTVIKTVINDDGGTAVVGDFKLFVTQGRSLRGDVLVRSGEPNKFAPGKYKVYEVQLPGYTASDWSGDCAADGTITLAPGDNKVCRITNNDNPVIPPRVATLKLVKHVINDNGGTAVVSDFNLYANDIKFVSGVSQNIQPGTYKAREDQIPGYTASDWSGDCAADGTITLAPGDNKTCHITNNDDPVIPNAAVLTVIKTVINDDGGTAVVGDFKLFVTKERVLGRSLLDEVLVRSGEPNKFAPGKYKVYEVQLPGYTASDWSGDCAADGTITLAPGDNKVCRITNNDIGGGDDDDDDDDDDGGGGGGGGGSSSRRRPKVTLFSNPEILGASVSLTQIPYTGLGTSILQIALFMIGLVALSGGAVYLFARRRIVEVHTEDVHIDSSTTSTAQQEEARILYEETIAPPVDEAFASYDEYAYADDISTQEQLTTPTTPDNLPVATAPVSVGSVVRQNRVAEMAEHHKKNNVSVARLQGVARSSQVLISDDGIKLIVAAGENDEVKSIERLTQVIEVAKTRYPREDGWLVLDATRVRESLFISILTMVPLFIEWIVRGEDKHVFAFMRMLKAQNQPVSDFVRKVVAELDNAHRARLEGSEDISVDPHVAEITYHLSNRDLEAIVSELLLGVDERYDSAYTSVRLALTRVLDIVRSRSMLRIGGTYAFDKEQREA